MSRARDSEPHYEDKRPQRLAPPSPDVWGRFALEILVFAKWAEGIRAMREWLACRGTRFGATFGMRSGRAVWGRPPSPSLLAGFKDYIAAPVTPELPNRLSAAARLTKPHHLRPLFTRAQLSSMRFQTCFRPR